MEVYAIGGKPLILDGKLCKVATGGGGGRDMGAE